MNKVSLYFLVCCLFAVGHASWFHSAQRQKRSAGHHEKMTCLGKEIDMKDCFKGWHECAKEIMPEDFKIYESKDTTSEKKKEIGKKMHENGCVSLCQWTKHRHVFGEDGSFNTTAINTLVEAVYPTEAHEGLKKGMNDCHASTPNAFKKDETEHCPEMKKFEACIGKVYVDVCKISHAPPSDPTEN